MASPPPTPSRLPSTTTTTTATIRSNSWRQPSPIQTPECTTRTLAFDSTTFSVRAKKRRRRVAQAGAFITTRRPSHSEEINDKKEVQEQDMGQESTRKWTVQPLEDILRHSTLSDGQIEDNHKTNVHESPVMNCSKTLETSSELVVQDNSADTNQQKTVERLRQLVTKCSEQHHVMAALFYADKLVTMCPTNDKDVLMFANACYLNREYHRAIHAIRKKTKLVDMNSVKRVEGTVLRYETLRAAYLIGKCMLAIKQKEECLELLGTILPEREHDVVLFAKKVQLLNAADQTVHGINVVSSLVLLMGETFEAIGNRENAMVYFRIALRCDVQNSEAFFYLFDKQMLSPQEEKELVASLDFSSDEMQLLELLYQTQVGKYNSAPSVDEKFTEVEQRFGLVDNLDLNVMKAETFYYRHDIQQAHDICESVREQDPFNFRVISVYVGTLVELGKKRELYHYAHQMVDVYPTKAPAWYTVGCYYLLIQKYEAAQRYFHKATSLEPSYAPAWIGFGNSFAAQDESDQAMSSYRTASSLFPGSHLPSLYMGMEYLRTNNLVQAQEFIRQASIICPTDPLVYNELGSVFYRQEDYLNAIEMFTKALDLCKGLPERLMEAWEPTLFNLGYSYRKLRKFDQAIYYFQSALRLSPRNASILAALGFTYHMKGCLDQAIETYHMALAYAPEDTLAGSMIIVAFEESLSRGLDSFPEFATSPPNDAPITSGLTPLTVRRAAGLDGNAQLSQRTNHRSFAHRQRQRRSFLTPGPQLQQLRTQLTVSVLESQLSEDSSTMNDNDD
ncbi:unnamed protein product [Peronospora belbahrii]|uniref:Anaphase-promoting complex subunit 6 n=1 Tax=Peronospora belbahrii TaxID=622444 RepID=A0AAU9KNY4_9STRA|nr:unnamed protein product [Peronospora belbahrii]